MNAKFSQTEREAKQKICPLSLYTPVPSKCIGSDCMGWRYDYTMDQSYGVATMREHPRTGEPYGFCGMPGKLRVT